MVRHLSSFTDELIAAHQRNITFEPGPIVPATVDEAYFVQTALVDAIGPVGGFKVSQRAGSPATMAPIPASRCFDSGAIVRTPSKVGVELEVGFVVIAALPDPDDPDFRSKLISAVRPAPMIELVATRLTGPTAEEVMPKLADLQANEALVQGDPLVNWDGSDFGTLAISMASDTGNIWDGPATVPGGSALRALETLVKIAGVHCGGVAVGHRILTGTLHPIHWIETGQAVRGRIDGLGAVSVDLAERGS
ncbi:MAG: 2-keto-4-pentenoate hydratase [Pseudomonadota bacterium]